MSKPLDINLSTQIAEQIGSKAHKCFDNAYQAALLDNNYLYVQGFLVVGIEPYSVMEYGWIELTTKLSILLLFL